MSKTLQKTLSLLTVVVGVILMFTMSADAKMMNLGILATLIGLIWFVISWASKPGKE